MTTTLSTQPHPSTSPTADAARSTSVAPMTVAVVGMGYVGLTLTAALAAAGHTVHGIESNPMVLETLRDNRMHIKEPGVREVLTAHAGSSILPSPTIPDLALDAVILAVSTPVDPRTHLPHLDNLRDAVQTVAQRCRPGTLVVVRSTVPIGTTRTLVLPVLRDEWGTHVRLCMAPERTIQGQALREIVELPQVVGGIDDESLAAGVAFFDRLVERVVPVSTTETAEMVKLANNCHTDLIYGFGNEIALIAGQHHVDPLEVIRAANIDYPRPDLSKPGFVGGACLTKDPYHMLHGTTQPAPFLVGAARALNEYMPVHVATTVVELIRQTRGKVEGARLGVLGWACKGSPPTDDMRGAPIELMMPVFAAAGIEVVGEDPEVADEVVLRHGGTPMSLSEVVQLSDGLLVSNDHPSYIGLDLTHLANGKLPRFVYDVWRVLDESALEAAGIRYVGLGYRERDVT